MILSVDNLDAVEQGSANDNVCERRDGSNKFNEAHNDSTKLTCSILVMYLTSRSVKYKVHIFTPEKEHKQFRSNS